jgi:hypothetical protein
MQFKRQEGFRYTFDSPIKGTFQLTKQNNQPIDVKPGFAEILDLSPNGLRISSSLDIPLKETKWEVMTIFALNETPISLKGSFIWKKTSGPDYHYGIVCENSMETKNMVIREMKEYLKSNS